jgi:hypothetical protein
MSKSSDKLDRLSRESREGEAMAARRRRAAPKEMRDTLALIKTLKLLVKNKKMKLHTAARIASPYTTGASPDAITRRIVKGIKTTLHEYSKTRAEKDDRHLVEDGFTPSHSDVIILKETIDILEEIPDLLEEMADLLEETSNPREAGFSRGATAAVIRRWRRNARKLDKISQRGEKEIKQYALEGSLRQRSSRVISDLEFEIDMLRIRRPKFFDALINKVSP